MKEQEITHGDLLSFIGGKANSETKRRIAAEMEVEGSFTNNWLKRLTRAAGDPFAVAWGELVSIGETDETADVQSFDQDEERATLQVVLEDWPTDILTGYRDYELHEEGIDLVPMALRGRPQEAQAFLVSLTVRGIPTLASLIVTLLNAAKRTMPTGQEKKVTIGVQAGESHFEIEETAGPPNPNEIASVLHSFVGKGGKHE